MRLILAWLLDQRSTVAAMIACILLLITVVLRYGFDLWWPFGIVMAMCGNCGYHRRRP